MGQNIERAVQRARQYWYDDGLTEIATGCVFVAIGLLFLAEAYRVILPGASSIGFIVVVGGGMLVARLAVGLAKAKLTYPRTGYVRYQRDRSRRRNGIAGGVAGFMAAILASLFASAPASHAWRNAVDGLVVGAFILFLGYSLGLSRFYALALFSAAAGAIISMEGTGDILGSSLYFLTTGVAILVSGTFVLVSYLRRTKRSEDE